MDNELFILLAGAGMAGFTQLIKRYFPHVNPMFFVGLVALILGVGYNFFSSIPSAELLTTKAFQSFAYATTVYHILKQFIKLK